jgi:hypothetical protein
MSVVRRTYGASPFHLLGVVASLAVTAYALPKLLKVDGPGVALWWGAGILLHDIALVGAYSLMDRSIRRFPWRNWVRVPAAFSGLLLLIWAPLILRLPERYAPTTGRSLEGYLWNWIGVTVALFVGSALLYSLSRARARRASPPAAAAASPSGS